MLDGKTWRRIDSTQEQKSKLSWVAELQECAKEDIGSKWVHTRTKSKVESSMHLLFTTRTLKI